MLNADTANDTTTTRKFSLRDKIGYSCGSFGNDLGFDLVSMYLMVFYTDVLGISPALTGGLLVFARTWDAFMDVVAGRYIDSRKPNKNGKFKPSVMRFSIPMAIFTVLTFTKLPGLSGNAVIIFAFACYVIYGTVHSFVAIPYGASAAVISTDSSERASLSTFRNLGANIGRMIITALIPIAAFEGNKPSAPKFFMIAFVLGIITVICYYGYYYLTTERLIDHRKKKKGNILLSLKGLIKSRPFVSQTFVGFCLISSSTIATTLNAYLFKDYFHNAQAMSYGGIIMILNIVLIAPLVAPISKKFGTRESGAIALLLTAISYLLLFILPIQNAYLFVVFQWMANAGSVYFGYIIWAFINDVSDYHEFLTGLREDGTIMAIYQYCRKLGQSVAVALCGVSLSAIGYTKAAQQTTEVAANIKVIATLYPAIVFLIMFLALRFWYPLNREKLAQLQIDLQNKRKDD